MRLYNIWDDPEHAEIVRSAAQGTETVPTVLIDGHALVNPTPQAVEALLLRVAPDLLGDQEMHTERRWFWQRR